MKGKGKQNAHSAQKKNSKKRARLSFNKKVRNIKHTMDLLDKAAKLRAERKAERERAAADATALQEELAAREAENTLPASEAIDSTVLIEDAGE